MKEPAVSEFRRLLDGQVALVTGASSGIGSAIACALAKAGAQVTVNHHQTRDAAAEVVNTIERAGGQALAVDGDVSQEADVTRLFDMTVERFGRIDIVVSNAGIQKDASITGMTLAQWQEVIGVNLGGQFLCVREGVKRFLTQGVAPASKAKGKIICMSSVHQVIPWAGHVNYSASKGGIQMMMKSVAQEVAAQGIRVNAIAPGAIKTPINESAWSTPEQLEKLLKLIPYGRIGVPEDIGKAAVWLASDDADYVTGTTLFVDGGMSLYPAFRDNG